MTEKALPSEPDFSATVIALREMISISSESERTRVMISSREPSRSMLSLIVARKVESPSWREWK
jgi:hypothetical protein